jgi:predicted RNA methylase
MFDSATPQRPKPASFEDDLATVAVAPVKPASFEDDLASIALSPAPETTVLTPEEERQFQQWGRKNQIVDLNDPRSFYDYRGYWKEKGETPIRFGVDHFTDTYKQHGHPTFSRESKYSWGPGDGGTWEGETFVLSDGRRVNMLDPQQASAFQRGALPAPTERGSLVTPGNIDLWQQPRVRNADGRVSTVRSISVNIDGQEVLIPTVAHDGSRILSNDESVEQYKRTGKHLGIFGNVEAANAYAAQLHNEYAAGKYDRQTKAPTGGQFDPETGTWQPAPLQGIGAIPFQGAQQVARGVSNLVEPPRIGREQFDPETGTFQPAPMGAVAAPPAEMKKAMRAATDVLNGAAKMASPLVVAGLIADLPGTLLTLALSTAAAKGARETAKAAGGDEDTQAFLEALSGAVVAAGGAKRVYNVVAGTKKAIQIGAVLSRLYGQGVIPGGKTTEFFPEALNPPQTITQPLRVPPPKPATPGAVLDIGTPQPKLTVEQLVSEVASSKPGSPDATAATAELVTRGVPPEQVAADVAALRQAREIQAAQQPAPAPVVVPAPPTKTFVSRPGKAPVKAPTIKATVPAPPVTSETPAPVTFEEDLATAATPPAVIPTVEETAAPPEAPVPTTPPKTEVLQPAETTQAPVTEEAAGAMPVSTPERDALVERIVTAARKPEPEIVPVREDLYSDGKWHSAFGVPHGVTNTGQTRIAGYVFRASDGTTHGRRYETPEAAREAWRSAQATRDEEFRQALLEMPDDRIQSQAEYWMKGEAPKVAQIPATPTPKVAETVPPVAAGATAPVQALPAPPGWKLVVGRTRTKEGHTYEAEVNWRDKEIVFADQRHLDNPEIRNHEIAHVLIDTLSEDKAKAFFDEYIALKSQTPDWQKYGAEWIVKNHFHREESAMDAGSYFTHPEKLSPELRALFDRHLAQPTAPAAAGKPVPPDVLAEYPDLQPNPPMAEPVGPSAPTTNATVSWNKSRSSIEVKFPGKPKGDVLEKLKRAGFRWAKTTSTWYHAKPERLANTAGTFEQVKDSALSQVRMMLGLEAWPTVPDLGGIKEASRLAAMDRERDAATQFVVGEAVKADEGRGEVHAIQSGNVKIRLQPDGRLSNWIPASRVSRQTAEDQGFTVGGWIIKASTPEPETPVEAPSHPAAAAIRTAADALTKAADALEGKSAEHLTTGPTGATVPGETPHEGAVTAPPSVSTEGPRTPQRRPVVEGRRPGRAEGAPVQEPVRDAFADRTFESAYQQAVASGYTGTPDALRPKFTEKLDGARATVRDLRETAEEFGFTDILRLIAQAGGVGQPTKETTYPEIARAFWDASTGTRDMGIGAKGARKLRYLPSGDIAGVVGVVKWNGKDLDTILEAVRESGRHQDIERIQDLEAGLGQFVAELRHPTAAPGMPTVEDLLSADLEHDPEWWTDNAFAFGENAAPVVDVTEAGLQPRLPGAESVRDQEIATPEYEAPFSLNAEAATGTSSEGRQHDLSFETGLEQPTEPPPAYEVKRPESLENRIYQYLKTTDPKTWGDAALFRRTVAAALSLPKEEIADNIDALNDAAEAALNQSISARVASYVPDLALKIDIAREAEAFLPRAHRSLEKTALQQFSTPLPISVAVVQAAMIDNDTDRVLEPTAGTGNLLTAVPHGTAIMAGELSDRRADLLRAQGYNVSQGDYLATHDRAKDANAPTVILTNPPWGKYTKAQYGPAIAAGFTPTDVAERFISKNMRDLALGGRLVAVMPTTMLQSPSFKFWLRKHFTVQAVIKSPPNAYRTRSTDVESILLVVDKVEPAGFNRTANDRPAFPMVVAPDTWEAYIQAVEAVHARSPLASPGRAPEAPRPAPEPRPGRPSERPRPQPSQPRRDAPVGTGRPAVMVAGEAPVAGRPAVESVGAEIRTPAEPPRASASRVSADTADARRKAAASDHFAPYPRRTALRGVGHPRLIVEARQLAGVPYPALTRTSVAIERVVHAGRVSVEQAEQALAALQANLDHQHGYLVADGVGVGKAREVALTILGAMEQAKKDKRELRLLVTTKSADNIKDMIEKELPYVVTGRTLDGLDLNDPTKAKAQGSSMPFEIVTVTNFKGAKKEGKEFEPLPSYKYAIYIVDSYNLAPYREALNGVGLHGVVGDEAHRFKNVEGAAVGGAWQNIHATIFKRVERPHQFFAYFTATPAQDITDYQYLYGLHLWPIDGFGNWLLAATGALSESQATELEAATERGSIRPLERVGATGDVVGSDAEDVAHGESPRMGPSGAATVSISPAEAEQIPREWKIQGRFSSRDLWRDGTEFEIQTATLSPTHKKKYEQFVDLALDIFQSAYKWGLYDTSGRASRFGVAGQLQFAAKRIQMQPAIEEAIRVAKAYAVQGYQPVLSLINVTEMTGDKGNIAAAINKINARIIDKDPNDPNGGTVDMGEIPEALIDRARLLDRARDLGVFDDPIEMVEEAFGKDQVALVIGDAGKSREVGVREFQQGKRAYAVISGAGTTGISLDHRVFTGKHPGRGRRVFIDVQYEWSATEAFQRYGRIDRASQVSAPKILALTFGNASEKKFLATIANRMAALGALSKGGAESTGGASALEVFEITGDDALEAARQAYGELSEEDRRYFAIVKSAFRDPNRDKEDDPFRPTRIVTSNVSMKDFQLPLLFMPIDTSNNFWHLFEQKRAEIRSASGWEDLRRTQNTSGVVMRQTALKPNLLLTEVQNEKHHKFGILSGLVTPEMPKLRTVFGAGDYDEGGRWVQFKRRYTSFTAGDQMIAGLVVPWRKVQAVSDYYGAERDREHLDTPAKVLAALKDGEPLPLQETNPDSGQPWKLKLRPSDERVQIQNARMADRVLLQNHGATYAPVGNYWYVKDGELGAFLERFPLAEAPPTQRGGSSGGAHAGIGTFANIGQGTPATAPMTAPGQVNLLGQPASAPAGTSSQGVQAINPIEFPELVDLARDLMNTPAVVKGFRGDGKVGEFRPGKIRLAASLFRAGQGHQLAAALAHEIGHLVDWLPNQVLKRGNLLGRLRTLQSFLKHTFTDPATGNTIKLADVRAELLALSNAWRPWDQTTASDSFKAYRKSGVELYADALSVLLNDPGRLEREAPVFYREFFNAIDQKPDVKRAYFDLQALLSGTREELIARRRSGVRAMFEEGDAKALEIQARKLAEAQERQHNLWFRLKTQLVDKNYAVIDRVTALQKRGVQVSPDDDPRYLLEERNYLGGKLKGFTERHFLPVFEAVTKAGISWSDFGEALFYERIIAGDRSELANPRGITPAVAQDLLDSLRDNLGGAKENVLNQQMTRFRQVIKDTAEEAYQEGLYTDELHVQMMANPAYVTFQVLDHLEDNVTSRVYRQIGTLKDIANPADSSILKVLVTRRAIERQKMITGVVEFLEQYYPDDIHPARMVWNGKTRVPAESKDPQEHLITFYKGGHLEGRYVDPYIAGSVNNESIGSNLAVISLLRRINSGFFRPVFTTLNLGFQSFNFYRDMIRTWKNVPGMTFLQVVRRYKEAVPLSKARAFGKGTLQAFSDLMDAEEAGILSVTFNDLMMGRQVEDSQIEDILARTGVGGFGKAKRRHPLARPFLAVIDTIRELGDFIETLPKAAAIYHWKGRQPITYIPPDKRSFIRRKVGSPDFLAGGTAKPITNEVALFSNAITQVVRSDVEVMTDPATRAGFWWKTLKVNVIPKLLMFAAAAGLFGVTLKRIMRKATEYDRTNYTVIPLGEDEQGNAVYIRFPQDDTGRLVSGLLWKGLRTAAGDADALKTVQQVADYSLGIFPSVTPSIELLQQTGQFLVGQNPYDAFRGRNVFTDDEWKARDRHTVGKFIGWEFQQLGGGIVWKFTPGGDRPVDKTTAQRIFDLPVVSNFPGRFVRITNYGEAEGLKESGAVVARQEARQRLDERDAVRKAIRGFHDLPKKQQTIGKASSLAFGVARHLYADQAERKERYPRILAQMRMAVARGMSDPVTDAVLAATSTDQKVSIILQAQDDMTPSEASKWLRDALSHKVISANVYAAAVRAQAQHARQ